MTNAIIGLLMVLTGVSVWGSESAPRSWVEPAFNRVVSSAGCSITESFNPRTYGRVDYVRCPGEVKPQPFYRHSRGIGVLISGSHRFALVNDDDATKSSRVVLVDLSKHSRIDISSAVQRLYQQHVRIDPRVIVQPEGYEFSPTENSVLVKIGPTYFSVASAAEANLLSGRDETRWFVISTIDGQAVHEFGGSELPHEWWQMR